jgi:predicted phage-related endonuclease
VGISQQEKLERRDSVGASDVPAILNVSPFRNSHDVYLEKTTKLEDLDLSDSMAIMVGEAVESNLVDFGYSCLPQYFTEEDLEGMILIKDLKVKTKGIGAPKHANLDGAMVPDVVGQKVQPFVVIEAKTSSLASAWGPTDTNQIPDHVLVQVQFQMGISGAKHAIVAALLSDYRLELRTYHIEFDEDMFNGLCEVVDSFWLHNVESRTPPESNIPRRETLKRIRREPNKSVSVSDKAYSGLVAAKEKLKAAQAEHTERQNELIALLGDAEEGVCEKGTVTYFEQNRKGYEVKPSTNRVLRLKKKKEEKK